MSNWSNSSIRSIYGTWNDGILQHSTACFMQKLLHIWCCTFSLVRGIHLSGFVFGFADTCFCLLLKALRPWLLGDTPGPLHACLCPFNLGFSMQNLLLMFGFPCCVSTVVCLLWFDMGSILLPSVLCNPLYICQMHSFVKLTDAVTRFAMLQIVPPCTMLPLQEKQ